MTTIKIDIINPKAKKILQGLEDLNLISIEKDSKKDFTDLLTKLRRNSSKISFEEITKEVEIVRKEMHERS